MGPEGLRAPGSPATMAIKVSNIRLAIDEPEEALPRHLARRLGVPRSDLRRWRILHKSLDARRHDRIERHRHEGVELYAAERFEVPTPGAQPLEHRPIIVGSGPAGLFAAWLLATHGYAPLLLERGKAVRERSRDVRTFEAGGELDPESNYLFGEGGAGTFSDGKLTSRSGGADVQEVLRVIAECKGRPSILYEHRPHLGSNRLPAVVKAIRQRVVAAGGEVRFGCRVEDLELDGNAVRAVHTAAERIPADVALLAIGHSARDTYAMLAARGVPMSAKPFQMGVRIEQPQEQVNRARYGARGDDPRLGAADYELVARGRRDLFTFCMCAGGYVIPSVSEPGYYATNGMSFSRHNSPFANSGLVVTVDPSEFGATGALAGVELQRRCEAAAFVAGDSAYRAPIQWAADFLARRASRGTLPSSHRRGTVATDLRAWLPTAVQSALDEGLPILDRRWHGLFLRSATLVGPESRGSSPVRLERDPATRCSPAAAGLYPVGEGAGYAGGIVSAAVDGLRSAKAVIARYAPLVR
jgi:uncharacterized FAD-dependent dehydrogenase